MIDRQFLRYFLAVIDQGSFSAAARHCRVAQPSLSEGISKLERLLGSVLLERTNRRIQLTPAGAKFAMHARRIEAEFMAAEQTVRNTKELPVLRVGLASTLPPAWIEPALAAACLEPSEAIEIVEARAKDIPALLDRGRIDAAISLRSADDQPGETLWTEGYSMALPASHPLAREAAIAPEAVASETMFVRRDCEVLAEVSRYFTGHGVRPFMSARTTNEAHAISYVRTGLGITIVPRSFAAAGIALVPLAGFTPTRSVGLLTDPFQRDLPARSRPLLRMTQALRICARECFGDASETHP